MRYIVRVRLSGTAQDTGVEGASGVVITAETPSKAREMGAKQLGVRESEVEVIQHGELPPVFGVDRPLTKEEADEIFNQETKAVEGTWQPI